MISRLLIANRGEIAVRIARTAADMGIQAVLVYSEDDARSGHLASAEICHPLRGVGASAYLDIEQLIAAALAHDCQAVHPGYGFLSESSAFAAACEQAGLLFVGPSPQTLALLGDKQRARELAVQCGVAVSQGTGVLSLDDARQFCMSLGPDESLMLKAVAGGGGKGMRQVKSVDQLEAAYQRCQSEALRYFGCGQLYAERVIRRARHIEVQIIGDGASISSLGERDCSIQLRHQKLLEVAPSPVLTEVLRQRIIDAALRMAKASSYRNVGTFEFLLDLDRPGAVDEFVFIEANPRIQVEHTVTEAVFGLDLVQIQLELAMGKSLSALSLDAESIAAPRGVAMQLRVNLDTARVAGPQATIEQLVLPAGPGVRVDTFLSSGSQCAPNFDALLAKVVIYAPDGKLATLHSRATRALQECQIHGVETNLALLRALLAHPALLDIETGTRFVDDNLTLLQPAHQVAGTTMQSAADGVCAITAPLQGAVVEVHVTAGDVVAAGDLLVVLEALKLEHEITAPADGEITAILVSNGMTVDSGAALLTLAAAGDVATHRDKERAAERDLDDVRDDLARLRELTGQTLDDARPDAVAKRRARGQRTARENIDDLCDAESFIEYGQLAVAYLHARKSLEELRQTTPADGFVMGTATVNADLFAPSRCNVVVGSYDATVMAGTQGHKNHQKTDRLFALAKEHKLPLVLFAEGGGGRPREDPVTIAALENVNFRMLAELSGHVPVVGVVSGRCFAGNAALLGMADVIIATHSSNIGMAGPALIEAGGLGSYTPEQVGPIEVQQQNGVVDIAVLDEGEAVVAARRYLGYFQGSLSDWQAHDSRRLRQVVPESRLRAYDVREAINLIADIDSVLELRSAFGRAYVTALIRVEGRPLGVIANNPKFNSGAIDSDSADKAARFMRLCDAHGLPLLTLIDTPGIMVGPEAEKTALVRHSARLFLAAASMRVPVFAVVLRKAYGLGAMAAAGGHFKVPFFTVAWPSGELGGMGLEGGVRLAYKNEMAAIDDPVDRQTFFEERVASRYRKGQASHIASYFELDAVIDPADTRRWIRRGLLAAADKLTDLPGRFIDSW